MQYRCGDWAFGYRCNNTGFMEGRWNVILAVILNDQGVRLMSSMVNTKSHLALWWKWGSCISSAPQHPFYSVSYQQFVDDKRLSPPHGFLYCTIAPLCSTTLPILSRVSCTLFPISAYILPNPHNPTVVWVKYLVPAVSSHLLLGCDFCILLFTHWITTGHFWKVTPDRLA